MELAHPLDATPQDSPLALAREKRHLSIEQVALRTGLSEEEVEWLEGGRVYRFPSQNAAVLAAVVYATALGIDRWEARKLAGLPVTPGLRVNAKARLLVVAAVAALFAALAVMVLFPNVQQTRTRTVEAIPNANLLPPWKLNVTVLNGSDITWTRTLASRIGAMGYTIAHVGRADRFDYQSTNVYYGPGGQAVGLRLARQLRVSAKSAPGLNRNALLVIAGARRAVE